MGFANMDNQSKPSRPVLPPPLPLIILCRKTFGMLFGAIAGIPVGWVVHDQLYPWAKDSGHFLAAGALAGAVIGAVFPGRRLGRLGWAVVLGTGAGAFIGWSKSFKGTDLAYPIGGFFLGLICGMILEFYDSLDQDDAPA